MCAPDPNSLQHEREIIRDDAITRPLAEESKRNGDEETVSIAMCATHLDVAPSGMGVLLLVQGLRNLNDLVVDKLGGCVAAGMPVRQYGFGFIIAPNIDQPSWRLGRDNQSW